MKEVNVQLKDMQRVIVILGTTAAIQNKKIENYRENVFVFQENEGTNKRNLLLHEKHSKKSRH